MPSILVETGFINNPDEEKYLNSDDGQEEIVNSIVRAIIKYRKENE
jgi:N-acetylmuramoyl-L-alanine amidase